MKTIKVQDEEVFSCQSAVVSFQLEGEESMRKWQNDYSFSDSMMKSKDFFWKNVGSDLNFC
ncbi:MAG: hypothetical protein NC095_03755 [Muribaculum sp.]|nr:hypothetical protein [Muribaculum sp.]